MKYVLLLVSMCLASCATLKTDATVDWKAVSECAKNNPMNLEVQGAAVQCFVSVVAGNYAQCLNEILPVSFWSQDELTCVAKQLTGVK